MAELVVYLAGEYLAAEAIAYFGISEAAIFTRAAIKAGSFVVTTKAAQSMGLIGGTANELKGQTINVRSSTAPRQLIYGQSLVGGVMFYAATTGSTNEYLHTVFGLADHQIQSVEKVYFGDEDVGTVSGNVSSGRYSGKARIQNSLTGGTAYADLVTETAALTNKWTSSHKLTGISSVYVRMQYDTSVFTSIPTVRALVKGKLVYDPRTTTTAWSDNPALCIRDYIMSDYGLRATSDEIDSASFIAAANICDETVTVKTAVTQKRYTLNGVVDTSKSPREVLQDMLSTCSGMLIYSSGKYKLIAGAFSSPVQTITVDDLRGDVQLSCANEKANLFNRVVGVFADADKLYSATEYPAISSNTFKAEDGGEELTAQLDLNFTTNIYEAERLAKINLLKSRQGIVVNISCKPTCLNITAGDVVGLTIDQLGWSGKYFRVMEWKLNEDMGVDLVLKEEDSTAYDWSTSDAIDGAPNTSLTLIQPQAAPTNLTATNQNLSLPDGTILPAAHITWTAVASAYVTGYELQFKLSTDTVWQSLFTSQTVYDYVGQQEVALVYNFRVRAIFSDKNGPFSSTINHTLSGDTTAPAAPTSLSAVGAYKTIQLSWTNPTAADWFYNEVWENSTNNSATATKIGEVSSSTLARSGLTDSATKYYWLKAVDFSRNVSGFSNVASATTEATATGIQGASARICYSKTTLSSLDTTPTTITTSGSASFPANNSWGTGTVWQATAPAITAGESVYQSDGIYDPTTNNTIWNVPYLSALKVGSLSAITANTGNLTVSGTIQSNTGAISGTTMTGSGAVIYSSGNFAVGNSTNNITYNGSAITLNGTVVFPANINSNNLTLKDGSGNVILGNGTPLNFANITPASGWLNSNISIGSNGVLSGAGGGAVTITGLGTTGSFGGGQIAINTDFLVSTSNIPYGFGQYNNAATPTSFSIASGGAIGNAKYWRMTTTSSTPASTQFGFFFDSATTLFGGWKANTSYIVSFFARSSNVSGSGFYSAWNSAPPTNTAITNPNITSTWQRYVWLINFGTSSIDPNGFWSIGQSNLPSGSQLEFSCIQVEVGDAVSGWSASTWVDSSGQIQGTNAGAGTPVANSLINLGTLGAGAFAYINAITTANVSTYINSAAIGTAQVGVLAAGNIGANTIDASKIAANTITAGQIAANSITADRMSVSTLSAITANLGTITAGSISGSSLSVGSSPAVSGTTMTGAGAKINTDGTFALGNSTTNISYNGTQMSLNGNVVSTGNINSNAVTLSASAFTSGESRNTAIDTWQDLQTVSITTSGQRIYFSSSGNPLTGSGDAGESGSAPIIGIYRLVRDSTELMQSNEVAMSYSETPSAGTYTYKLQCKSTNPFSADPINSYAGASNRSIFVIETKR